MFGAGRRTRIPEASESLAGNNEKMPVPGRYHVNCHHLEHPFPEGMETALFGLGCFWGAERKFRGIHGVYSTSVGYAGGYTPDPTYQGVCSWMTGHNGVVRVDYDSGTVTYEQLLEVFRESHDPTQRMRQGNDIGKQYRSGIYTSDTQQKTAALKSRDACQTRLSGHGPGLITTDILDAPEFCYAEE